MGKIKILSFFTCYLCLAFCYAQQYEITYELTCKPKIDDTITLKHQYNLQINHKTKESLFISSNNETPLNILIYKNFNQNKFTKYESIVGDIYEMNYQFDNKSWKLIGEKKEILEFNCYKAELNFGGRKWIAWYALDIPLQDGPYKFCGLPGLIIEIYSSDNDYHFTTKGVRKLEDLNIKTPPYVMVKFPNSDKERDFKLKIIDDPASEYRKQMLQLKSNNMGISVSYNGKRITPKETEQRIIDDFEKWIKNHDNPIEKGELWIK